MLNFTVNPVYERAFEWYLHGVGFIVLPLNLFTFYLIYAKTPKHSRTYRRFVLHMQCWSTLVDTHVGLLFMPMPLFPLTGGYCSGLLCRVGLPMHYSIVLMYFAFCGTFLSMGLSIFYRHQLILPQGHWLRIGKNDLSVLLFVFSFIVQSPTITLLLGRKSRAFEIRYLEENHPAMLWLAEKDNWAVYEPYEFPLSWMCIEVIVLSVSLPFLYFVISYHLYRGISSNIMSTKTRNLHRRIVLVLIGQVLVFCIFLMIPLPFFILSVFVQTICHEATLPFFAMLYLYSWTHSLVLIATTPSYRAVIASFFHPRTGAEEERKCLRAKMKVTSSEPVIL